MKDSLHDPTRKFTFLPITILALSCVLFFSVLSQGAVIIVDNDNTAASTGECTLEEAVFSVSNQGAAGNGCVDGNSPDTIRMLVDATLPSYLGFYHGTDTTLDCAGHTIDINSANGGPTDLSIFVQGEGASVRTALTITNCIITGGVLGNNNGGAVYVSKFSDVTVTNSTIEGNSAHSGAGIFVLTNGTAMVRNSTIKGNTALDAGGGITVNHGTLTLINSTISGNTSEVTSTSRGGGISVYYDSTVTIRDSTITNNLADEGGGIYVDQSHFTENSTGNVVNIEGSIIAGNHSLDNRFEIYKNPAGGGYVEGTINANSFNIFGHSGETDVQAFSTFTPGANDYNATSDGNNILLTNILTTLADNGGPNQTHALVTGSPAIDLLGTCSSTVDQRYYARPTTNCDAGSYEVAATNPCATTRSLSADVWTMTAPPCAPLPNTLAEQHDDELGVYGTNWIAYTFDQANQNYSRQTKEDQLIQGEGNWFYTANAGTIDVIGSATPLVDCATVYGFTGDCFVVPLTIPASGDTGLNMVGHPFPYTVDWADVRIATSPDGTTWNLYTPSNAETAYYVEKAYYLYNGNAYETRDDATGGMIGVLQPQESIWVRIMDPANYTDTNTTDIRLLIPAQ